MTRTKPLPKVSYFKNLKPSDYLPKDSDTPEDTTAKLKLIDDEINKNKLLIRICMVMLFCGAVLGGFMLSGQVG